MFCGIKPVRYDEFHCTRKCREDELELRKRERKAQFEENKTTP